MRAYERLKAYEEIVINLEDEEELMRQMMRLDPALRRQGAGLKSGTRGEFLSVAQGKELGLRVKSDEI